MEAYQCRLLDALRAKELEQYEYDMLINKSQE
jgi:hypothetical protein